MLFRSHFFNLRNKIILCLLVFFSFFTKANFLLSETFNNEVFIRSEKASFDQKLGVIYLNENVVLNFKNMTFKSDEMKLFFSNGDNSNQDSFSNLNKVSAKGNVQFERDQEIIKSDLAFFFPNDNKIQILGNVNIVKGKNLGLTSDTIEINLKTGVSSLKGNIASKFKMESKD